MVLDAVFHALGISYDDNGLRLMKQAVEYGRGEPYIVDKDGGPLFVGEVGRLSSLTCPLPPLVGVPLRPHAFFCNPRGNDN